MCDETAGFLEESNAGSDIPKIIRLELGSLLRSEKGKIWLIAHHSQHPPSHQMSKAPIAV